MRDHIEEILAVIAFITLAAVWYVGYVQPNDTHMWAVVNCVEERGGNMGDEALWNECHNDLIPKAGTLVQVFHPAVQ